MADTKDAKEKEVKEATAAPMSDSKEAKALKSGLWALVDTAAKEDEQLVSAHASEAEAKRAQASHILQSALKELGVDLQKLDAIMEKTQKSGSVQVRRSKLVDDHE